MAKPVSASHTSSNQVKMQVIRKIAGEKPFHQASNHKFRVTGFVIHVRFVSAPKNSSNSYTFDVYPNTLTADYEVWICEAENYYYLIPITKLREMYPYAYGAKKHPEARLMSVDINHRCSYSRSRPPEDFSRYFTATLPSLDDGGILLDLDAV